MPSARRPKRPAKGRVTRARGAKGFRCPDCDFVARHAMGLGRHRSARHGVQSQRQKRRESAGGWVTRQEAARRAGVHYNTIRHWEKTGRLRRSRSAGRGAMVSAADLEGLRTGSAATMRGVGDDARIQALEKRFNDLIDGLERLVAGSRIRPRRGRPPGSTSRTGKG